MFINLLVTFSPVICMSSSELSKFCETWAYFSRHSPSSPAELDITAVLWPKEQEIRKSSAKAECWIWMHRARPARPARPALPDREILDPFPS